MKIKTKQDQKERTKRKKKREGNRTLNRWTNRRKENAIFLKQGKRGGKCYGTRRETHEGR